MVAVAERLHCWDCGAPLSGDAYTSGLVRCTACEAFTAPPRGVTDQALRCWRCHKLLLDRATRPWQATCPRCKAQNRSA